MPTKGVVAYLILTFSGTWTLWLLGRLLAIYFFHITSSNIAFQAVVAPGAFVPAIACIIVRKWITREGFADAGLRINFRKKWRYFFFAAYILPLFVLGIIISLAYFFQLSTPDFSLHRSLSILAPQISTNKIHMTPPLWIGLVVELMLVGIPFAALVTWGEEFGWRSYLQIRLFAKRPLLAAITTGLIWGIWHYPIILMGYEHYDNVFLGLVTFPINTILLSIIFGWLRIKTGSIWTSSIAHGSTNNFGASLSFLLFLGGSNFIFVSYLGILSWIPLSAVCAWIIMTRQLTSK